MFNKQLLVLSTDCEVYDQLKPWADAEFWNFQEHVNSGKLIPDALYLIGRWQFLNNVSLIRQLLNNNTIKIILSNPFEGSETLKYHCTDIFHVDDLVKSKQLLLIGGGDMESDWPCLQYDWFLTKMLDYTENLTAIDTSEEIYTPHNKSYKFLFLNGRGRHHRFYLLRRFQANELLDKCLWTNLDTANGMPIHYLPIQYEIDRFRKNYNITYTDQFVKSKLFGNESGEIYLNSAPYIDTYFSVITETVFNYPYSFRTEKIWKPIAMGHPWIAVSNRGYYRDMHNLGFKTFGHVIDESFDLIDHNPTRIERIADIIEDLCQQDLAKFLAECYNVCKYNQQHLAEMRVKVRKEFPDRFFKFIEYHNFS